MSQVEQGTCCSKVVRLYVEYKRIELRIPESTRALYICAEVGEEFGHDGEAKERKVGAWRRIEWGWGSHEG